MKKMNLRQALLELKEAKSFAQRVAATSNLMNQTAYKAGQFLYGTHTADPAPKSNPDPIAPDTKTAPDMAPSSMPKPVGSDRTQREQEVDYFTKGLMKLNEDLKALRIAKELAHTDVERNAIHFKILRLERERRNYLAKRQTP